MSHLPPHDLGPATVRRLERDADVVLAQRAVYGSAAYAVSLLGFTVATEFGARAHSLAVTLTVAIFVLSGARLLLYTPDRWSGTLGAVAWRRAFFGLSTGMLATYSLYVAAAVHLLGIVVSTILMMAASVTLLVGTAYSLSPRLSLVRVASVALVGLPLVAVLTTDAPARPLIAMMLSLYVAYLHFLGRKLHREYWQSAVAGAQLAERGDSLLRLQQQTRDLIEKNPDAMGILRGRSIVFVNAAWTNLLQRNAEELVGRPLDAFVHPEDADALRQFIDAAGNATALEFRFLRKDEGVVVWEISPHQPVEYEGAAAHLLVARDVTERNRMRAQLVLSDRLASIGTLAAGVAHEINNPLTYVQFNLEHLIEELRTSHGIDRAAATELAQVAEDARQGADRVRIIVRDLKTFSRAGEPSLGGVDLRPVVDMAMKMTATEIRHRARLVLELDDVPAVVGDEARLGQVLLNLLMNAAQAIPEGKAEENVIRVKTSVDPAGDVLVQVSDTGGGIRSEDLGRIFDPFFTTKPVGVGTGLGLSICHNIVRSFGGEISVASEAGQGTTVSVLLRRSSETARVAPALPPQGVASTARVLVVDDEPAVGRAIQRALRKDFAVVLEQTGQQALARLVAGEHFDAILCDLMMPAMTGMDLFELTVEQAPRYATSFVFMTGGIFTERASQFMGDVPNDRIEKPIDIAELRTKLRGRVDARRRAQATGSLRAEAPL